MTTTRLYRRGDVLLARVTVDYDQAGPKGLVFVRISAHRDPVPLYPDQIEKFLHENIEQGDRVRWRNHVPGTVAQQLRVLAVHGLYATVLDIDRPEDAPTVVALSDLMRVDDEPVAQAAE